MFAILASIDFDHDDWYRTFGMTDWQYVADEDLPSLPTPIDSPASALGAGAGARCQADMDIGGGC